MNEIFIYGVNGEKKIALVEDGVLKEYYEEDKIKKSKEGNIYIGRVQNVVQGMQSVFVDIGQEKNGYMYIKEIIDKIDQTKQTINDESFLKLELNNFIKKGDIKVVQIKKDAYLKKGAKLSTHISLQGDYIILLPNTNIVTISQKIDDDIEKTRLLNIVKQALPENYGCIVRTLAKNASKESILNDLKAQIEIWKEIKNIDYKKVPSLLYREEDTIIKMVKNMLSKQISRIVLNDNNLYNEFLKCQIFTDKGVEVIFDNNDLCSNYKLNKQIEKINDRKINLKSGGYIVIDKTEALTAIDVNSGRYTGNKNLEETAFKVNKDAAKEIITQLRLKDISGIIIIDFIDMKLKEHKKQILDLFVEECKKDRSKIEIQGFTNLNLLELTRKHIVG